MWTLLNFNWRLLYIYHVSRFPSFSCGFYWRFDVIVPITSSWYTHKYFSLIKIQTHVLYAFQLVCKSLQKNWQNVFLLESCLPIQEQGRVSYTYLYRHCLTMIKTQHEDNSRRRVVIAVYSSSIWACPQYYVQYLSRFTYSKYKQAVYSKPSW